MPAPPNRHAGPVGALGRLVSDLRMQGHDLTYPGPVSERRDHAPTWVFRVTCRDKAGAVLWTIEEWDTFEWEGAARALAALHERIP